jgi:uncharacterized membrane protein
LRIADWITAFAGSMNFVYIHIALFAIWMLFIESKPWPTLTLVVSPEAIFLSTFVMIGQNRQSAFQQAKADHDFTEQELELKNNTELTREIDKLTVELHKRLLGKTDRQQSNCGSGASQGPRTTTADGRRDADASPGKSRRSADSRRHRRFRASALRWAIGRRNLRAADWLYRSKAASVLWLVARLWLGYGWLNAGYQKLWGRR